MGERTKRERLTEALAAVGILFVGRHQFDFLLGCVECYGHRPGATWHPFYAHDVNTIEYDEDTAEEVGRLILTDEEKRNMRVWERLSGLRDRYWLCPNGCNAGADIPADLHPEPLGLRYIEHRDAVGHIIEGEEEEFKAWAESLPDDGPATALKVPTEAEVAGEESDGEPPEYVN
jgi:hypothetical protein